MELASRSVYRETLFLKSVLANGYIDIGILPYCSSVIYNIIHSRYIYISLVIYNIIHSRYISLVIQSNLQ